VRTWNLEVHERARFYYKKSYGTEGWFRYDRPNGFGSGEIYKRTAEAVLPFLEEAEKMWRDFERCERSEGRPNLMIEQRRVGLVDLEAILKEGR